MPDIHVYVSLWIVIVMTLLIIFIWSAYTPLSSTGLTLICTYPRKNKTGAIEMSDLTNGNTNTKLNVNESVATGFYTRHLKWRAQMVPISLGGVAKLWACLQLSECLMALNILYFFLTPTSLLWCKAKLSIFFFHWCVKCLDHNQQVVKTMKLWPNCNKQELSFKYLCAWIGVWLQVGVLLCVLCRHVCTVCPCVLMSMSLQ